ncbi:MAG: histidinol-phosphate transaminase [Pseudomonadota bacterium]|nr:histidinol-phosphate transaminase [Pseudomonadota bacterium]MDE3037806.1 histidinol-phosphate transaminase [Pseudomonadota bacterium]
MLPRLPQPKPGIPGIAPYVGGKSKALGGRAIKLSSNESPLGPSPRARKAFIEAGKRLHRYPDGNATVLREAIGKVHGIAPERIVCGAGSDELIGLLVHAYAGEGDEVLYSEHGFLMYKIYAQAAGATPVSAPEKNLRTDVDALLARVSPRTKIVFIANPNNPTGSYIGKKELQRLHKGLPPHVILAVDGAYAEYVENFPLSLQDRGEGYSCGHELAATTENTVMLRTFSKIYGLSSLRVGWAYAPAAIIDALNRIRGPFNVSQPGQEAAAAAMRDTAFTAKARKFNARWLAWLSREIGKLGLKVYPSIANFLLVEFPKGKHNAAKVNAFLMKRGLIVREVGNYGLPECLRISVGLEEDNRAVIKALRDFLS